MPGSDSREESDTVLALKTPAVRDGRDVDVVLCNTSSCMLEAFLDSFHKDIHEVSSGSSCLLGGCGMHGKRKKKKKRVLLSAFDKCSTEKERGRERREEKGREETRRGERERERK